MKPGDPVLSVDAPRGTKAVIAEFPFGPRRLCKFDASRERWACRFLVPRAVPDGVYIIKVTCIGARGERTRMEARYTVDSKAPLFEITALRVGDLVELKAFPKAFVLENGAHDVKSLRARGEDGRTVSFKLEKRPGEFVWSARLKAHGSLMIEAVDFAGNIRLSKVLQ
jgi:hypothetical protein